MLSSQAVWGLEVGVPARYPQGDDPTGTSWSCNLFVDFLEVVLGPE